MAKKLTTEEFKLQLSREHPELDEFLTKQIGKITTSKKPQLYIFQQIW